MSDDIFQIKPSFGGITLDVNQLLRKLRSKIDPAQEVTRRFLRLMAAHDVESTQIQRLFPEIGLDKLKDEKLLLASLSVEVLQRVATLFGVRQEWLEGVSDQIYSPSFYYKAPRAFFQDFVSLQRDGFTFPLRALYCGDGLDCRKESTQSIVLIFVERVAQWDDKDISRYRICGDEWDWSYRGSRIQIKAMVRLVYLATEKPVPLYQVDRKSLSAIRDGKLVPRDALEGCLLRNPSLEDFSLSITESKVASEVEELPEVLSCVEGWRSECLLGDFAPRLM